MNQKTLVKQFLMHASSNGQDIWFSTSRSEFNSPCVYHSFGSFVQRIGLRISTPPMQVRFLHDPPFSDTVVVSLTGVFGPYTVSLLHGTDKFLKM